MSKTIRHTPVLYLAVRRDGREFVLRATIDGLGPRFELIPMHAEGEAHVLTMDDASFAHTFLVPSHERDDIEASVRRVFESEYVFEVGIEVPWEGTHEVRLFRDYLDAHAYAVELTARESWDDWDVVIVPRRIE